MSHCRIISSWVYSESGESWGAAIEEDYPGLGLSDLVNPQNVPPQINVFVGESKAGGGLVNQIINDPNYSVGSILTTHETEATVPTQEKFDAIVQELSRLGMSSTQIEEAIGTEPSWLTLWEISQNLITWLKNNS